MINETTRLRAAIAAIHDHLHAGRVNEAHEACECAMVGEPVRQRNLTVEQSGAIQLFAAEFNALAQRHEMCSAHFTLLPSATDSSKVSVQIGGAVGACKTLERMLGAGTSLYQGDHAKGGA